MLQPIDSFVGITVVGVGILMVKGNNVHGNRSGLLSVTVCEGEIKDTFNDFLGIVSVNRAWHISSTVRHDIIRHSCVTQYVGAKAFPKLVRVVNVVYREFRKEVTHGF